MVQTQDWQVSNRAALRLGDWWIEGWTKPQLHATAMEMLARCPEQFRRRYVEGDIVPPGLALIVGTLCHTSAAADLTSKMDTERLLPVSDLMDLTRDLVIATFTEPVQVDEGTTKDAMQAQAFELGTSLAGVHHNEIAPKVWPKAIEEPFLIEGEGYPFDLAGTYDVIEADGAVRDLKTSARRKTQHEADNSLQGRMYAFARKKTVGTLPRRFVHDVIVKNKKPVTQELVTVHDDNDIASLLRRLDVSAAMIESGNFIPADSAHWCCSPKYCGYWSTCPFVNGKRRPTS